MFTALMFTARHFISYLYRFPMPSWPAHPIVHRVHHEPHHRVHHDDDLPPSPSTSSFLPPSPSTSSFPPPSPSTSSFLPHRQHLVPLVNLVTSRASIWSPPARRFTSYLYRFPMPSRPAHPIVHRVRQHLGYRQRLASPYVPRVNFGHLPATDFTVTPGCISPAALLPRRRPSRWLPPCPSP
jgi:hypothetical protein